MFSDGFWLIDNPKSFFFGAQAVIDFPMAYVVVSIKAAQFHENLFVQQQTAPDHVITLNAVWGITFAIQGCLSADETGAMGG